MTIVDMSKKDVGIKISEVVFSSENNSVKLVLKISNGDEPYDLVNKNISAVFTPTGIETGILSVTEDNCVVLPIYSDYIKGGLTNYIQLTFRAQSGDLIEQSPIMTWQIKSSLLPTKLQPSSGDVDLISSLIQQSRDAMLDTNPNGLGKVKIWTGNVDEYDNLEDKDANTIYFIGW